MADQSTPLGLSAHITVHDAASAIAFYAEAFGAHELGRHKAPNSEKLMYARIELFGSILSLNDDFPEFTNGQSRTPSAFGGCPAVLHLEVVDAEAVWSKALAAGAEVAMPLRDQFWGALYGQLRDPFGYTWSIGQTNDSPNHL